MGLVFLIFVVSNSVMFLHRWETYVCMETGRVTFNQKMKASVQPLQPLQQINRFMQSQRNGIQETNMIKQFKLSFTTMVRTRTGKQSKPGKKRTSISSKEKVNNQYNQQRKRQRKPWIPNKTNFQKCKLCRSHCIEIQHIPGDIKSVTLFPGSQYVHHSSFVPKIEMLLASIVVLQWDPNLSPVDIHPSTYWRAVVKEIREGKNGRIWLKVNWFYSMDHLLQPGILEEQWLVIPLKL